jgi:L-lactate dehydrogenase complex protein LldG
MFDLFKMRAEAVSAEVHRFSSGAAALDFILQFLRKEGITDNPGAYAVWADCRFLDGFDRKQLSEKVPGLKFDFSRDTAAESRIGITQMDWAIANTGSLMQDSTAVEQRLASSLPLIHVALVATDRLLADLPSLLTRIDPKESGYMAVVTGPSRTADIERVLTIGVHGPERLIIIFVDDAGAMGQ